MQNQSMASNGSLVNVLPILKSDRKQRPADPFNSAEKYGRKLNQTTDIPNINRLNHKRGSEYKAGQEMLNELNMTDKTFGRRNKSVNLNNKILSKIENNKKFRQNLARNQGSKKSLGG